MIQTEIFKQSDTNTITRNVKGRVVALGFFDSGHKGHQSVFEQVVLKSQELKMPSCVFTFPYSPKDFFGQQSLNESTTSLFSFPQRLRFFDSRGIDICVIPEMTPEFFQMTPEVFFVQLLRKYIRAQVIYAGENFRFGYQKSGDAETLKALGKQHGIEVHVCSLLKEGEQAISTSAIKNALNLQQYSRASAMLSRPDFLFGKVVHGSARGREMGFPTANIQVDSSCAAGQNRGVYVARIFIAGESRYGVVNMGSKPTFSGHEHAVEVHLFDFDGNIYGQDLALFLDVKLREEIKFNSVSLLASQIENDIRTARHVVESYRN